MLLSGIASLTFRVCANSLSKSQWQCGVMRVCSISAEFYRTETKTFKELVLCMGPFHWTRVLLRCLGKLIWGSGPDDALVECGIFRPEVIESVLNGSYYVRALTEMLIVEDVVKSLQCQSFWHHNKDAYPVLANVEALQHTLSQNKRCPNQFKALMEQTYKLHKDFREFDKQCEPKSELCQFFSGYAWYL